jgi:ribonuclease BN (tRNA processing enzyme)
MLTLRVHVTGVGDAFTERYHNASLCLEADGLRLQIDCPPAFPRVLSDFRKAGGTDLSIANIDHLLLTHLHGDHCGGTEAYLYLRRFVVGRKPMLHGAQQVLDDLWPSRLSGGMRELLLEGREDGPRRQLGLSDYCQRQDLDRHRTRIGPFTIEHRFTIHHIPTTAQRVRHDGDERPRLSYSADTAFDPQLISWMSGAEVLIHETNYGVHTPLQRLAELPPELRARMRLIHYPDLLDPHTAPIRCLREGETLEIGAI